MTAQPCPNTFFCRGPSGKTHPCVYLTVWPVSKRVSLVHFLTSVNTTLAKPFKWTYKGRPLAV
jgi:hypothetical protein